MEDQKDETIGGRYQIFATPRGMEIFDGPDLIETLEGAITSDEARLYVRGVIRGREIGRND